MAVLENIDEQGFFSSPWVSSMRPIVESIMGQRFRSVKAFTISQIGQVYDALAEYERAKEFYQQALNISRNISDRIGESVALNNLGSIYKNQGNYKLALERHQQALAIIRETTDQKLEATTLNYIGIVYYHYGDYKTALSYHEQALKICQESGDRVEESNSLNNIGLIYKDQGKYEQALQFFQQALKIVRELKIPASEATILNNIGLVYDTQRLLLPALEFYQKALAIQQQIGDKDGESTTLNNMAAVYAARGEYTQALDLFQKALFIQRQIGSKGGIGTTLNNMGSVYEKLSQYPHALKAYQEALTILQEIRNQPTVAATLNNIGGVYIVLGQYQKALDSYQLSLAISKTIDNPVAIGTTLNNIALLYSYRGQYQQALKSLEEALRINEKLLERAPKVATIANFAVVYQNQGQYLQALKYNQQSLTISKEIGDRYGEQRILNNIGATYESLGKLEQARRYFQQTLEIQRQLGDKQAEATTINNIAVIDGKEEKYKEALKSLQQARTILQTIGSRREEAATLTSMGEMYRLLEEYEQALNPLQQAIAIQQEIGDRANMAETLNNLAGVYHSLGNLPQALEYAGRSLVIFKEIGSRSGEGKVLANLGFFKETLGNTDAAVSYYQQAIEVIESIQEKLKIEDLKASFAGGQTSVYERLVELLWEKGRSEEAFNYVERSKARAFLDQLANGPIDFKAGANDTLLQQVRSLRVEISSLRDRFLAFHQSNLNPDVKTAALALVKEQIIAREKDYENLLRQLKIQSPAVASLVSVDAAKLPEIQSLLKADTTLVEYFVTQKRTLAFIITRERFQTITLPLDANRKNLTNRIQALLSGNLDNPHPITLQQMHQWLIAPIKPYFTTSKLTVVPHGILHYLPFAALTTGDRYLVEDYTLVMLPSASVLRELAKKRERSDTGQLLALGNPTINEVGLGNLRFAALEVKIIAKIYGNKALPLLGPDATESAVVSRAKDISILHLAAHGRYNDKSPLFSALYLAADAQNNTDTQKNDGRLEVHEIYGLPLTATRLVVLSACQTQVGQLSQGDELVALNRAFIFAGTPNVIATLWSVDDAPSKLLMEQLYNYLHTGMSQAEALQKAQNDVRLKHKHPWFWAGFVLTAER